MDEIKGLLNKHAAILALIAVFGVPSVVFYSYIMASKTPMAFIDSSTVANFFVSFYISVVFSFAAARALTFMFEIFYRVFYITRVLSKRHRSSFIYSRLKHLDATYKARDISDSERVALAKLFLKYYNYVNKSKELVEKRTILIFRGAGSFAFIVPIACIVFSKIYSGYNFILSFYSFLLAITMFKAVVFNSADYNMLARIMALISKEKAIIRPDRSSDPKRHATKARFFNKLKVLPTKAVRFVSGTARSVFSLIKGDIIDAGRIMKSDFSLFSIAILLFGIFLGFNKYRHDLNSEIKMVLRKGESECVSPLLATSGYMIIYSHTKENIAAAPHDNLIYYIDENCS